MHILVKKVQDLLREVRCFHAFHRDALPISGSAPARPKNSILPKQKSVGPWPGSSPYFREIGALLADNRNFNDALQIAAPPQSGMTPGFMWLSIVSGQDPADSERRDASNRNQLRRSVSSTQFSSRLAVAMSPCSSHKA